MSTLLKDAIVDAKALREAALKNAETTVIDKYAEEVRHTLAQILEQDDMDTLLPDEGAELGAELGAGELGGVEAGLDTAPPMDMDMGMGAPEEDLPAEEVAQDIPLAATDDLSENEGENLNGLPQSGEDVEVEINLDALQEAVNTLQNEQEIDIDAETLAEILTLEGDPDPGSFAGEEAEEDDEDEDDSGPVAAGSAAATQADVNAMKGAGLEEEIDISEDLMDEIAERLTVDMGATLSGWAGRSSESMKWEIEKELAHRRSTDVNKELEILKKAQEELVFENKQLKESLKQYKQATEELREGLHEVNLSNARLLYTNRVLRNTSLNERQKTKIADAISKAGSVTEAKTIYHTLENATPTALQRGPQSLSEALNHRNNSVIRASRRESTPSDPFAERMKRLAGIK